MKQQSESYGASILEMEAAKKEYNSRVGNVVNGHGGVVTWTENESGSGGDKTEFNDIDPLKDKVDLYADINAEIDQINEKLKD
jgi:hypothetical protein